MPDTNFPRCLYQRDRLPEVLRLSGEEIARLDSTGQLTSMWISAALLSKLLAGLPVYPPQHSVRTLIAEANQALVGGEKAAAQRRAIVRSPNARYTLFSSSTAAEPRPPP